MPVLTLHLFSVAPTLSLSKGAPLCLYALVPLRRFSPFTDEYNRLADFFRSLTNKTMKTEKVLSFL
jgi:hypothetical protein